MKLRTCVAPSGQFIYGIHKPRFRAENFRQMDFIGPLGTFADGTPCENHENFPNDAVEESQADWIFEIPNPFPFKGTTYIAKSWAEENAKNPAVIALPPPPPVSLMKTLKEWMGSQNSSAEKVKPLFHILPEPLLLSLAETSTDPEDLTLLAELSCDFIHDSKSAQPAGLHYQIDGAGRKRAVIRNRAIFEVVANNIFLPDRYKEVMVLRPGAQGGSEIIGEWADEDEKSHVFEYLRRNSYIPWGHYAANMAGDTIRYQLEALSPEDMTGMRHLYYQRTYTRVAEQLGIALPGKRRLLSISELETLRNRINETLSSGKGNPDPKFTWSLWGWNFGFDFAPTGYRLHASHQQIHQQFALIPDTVPLWNKEAEESVEDNIPAYACGDLIRTFIGEYREKTGKDFFDAYIRAIRTNKRMDGNKEGESSLVIFEDDHIMLFVPKAQTSQWELQLMTLRPIGNILESNAQVRNSLDRGLFIAMRVLGAMGARMISVIEYSKRFDSTVSDQRLLYAFLPRLPESPGAFSEAQLRWINGHYPEDFASACRSKLQDFSNKL